LFKNLLPLSAPKLFVIRLKREDMLVEANEAFRLSDSTDLVSSLSSFEGFSKPEMLKRSTSAKPKCPYFRDLPEFVLQFCS
jgi:hypothetical protein